MKKIDIYDGKYSFVMTDAGTIDQVLRHGQAWPAADDLRGMGVVLALVQEVEENRQEITRLEEELSDWRIAGP